MNSPKNVKPNILKIADKTICSIKSEKKTDEIPTSKNAVQIFLVNQNSPLMQAYLPNMIMRMVAAPIMAPSMVIFSKRFIFMASFWVHFCMSFANAFVLFNNLESAPNKPATKHTRAN